MINKRPMFRDPADVDDEEIPERDPKQLFEKGSIARSILPQLQFLVGVYMEDTTRAAMVQGFLKWVPGDRLEEYLVLALEYGMKRVMPKAPKSTRRVVIRR